MTTSNTFNGLTGVNRIIAISMEVMMITMMMPLNVESAFGIPDNVDFVSQLYNSSNCSNMSSYKNITLHHFCYDTRIENGYPRCCNELLSDISLFENASFRQCIKTGMTDANLTGVRYDCNMTHLKHMGSAGVLSYVGIISILLLAIMFMGWVISGGRKTYSKI